MNDDQGEDARRGPLAAAFRAMPAWVVSLIVHLTLLLVLAICTVGQPGLQEEVFVHGSRVEPQEATLEELAELQIESLQELEQSDDWSLFHEVLDPGEIAFGDLTAPTEIEAADGVGELTLPQTSIDEIGALFGKDGAGMADIGDGLKAAASFFGARARGRRFVFVVDNSNSMTRGRFETALTELMRTIDAMSPKQEFYIIFFSDTAYRMFHPEPVPGLLPATDQNKQRVRDWLYTVQMCLRTRGEEAMRIALALNPDVIYILGDGAFTDGTAKLLTTPHQRTTPIHTVGMEVDPVGEKQLRAIAEANGGTYRLVGASPMAKAAAARNPIPRNRTRGPVWGIQLPTVDGKAKPKRKRRPR